MNMLRAILLGAFVVAIATPADAQGRHRGYYHDGGGFAGGVIGGVIGGVLGSVISRPQYYPPQGYGYHPTSVYSDAVAYCIRRYRSYNPETGIWIGYDGIPRRCP